MEKKGNQVVGEILRRLAEEIEADKGISLQEAAGCSLGALSRMFALTGVNPVFLVGSLELAKTCLLHSFNEILTRGKMGADG